MQISFLKDLVTVRNPQSRFSFINYLHHSDRLIDFINRQTFTPERVEFADYLRWIADHITVDTQYNTTVTSIEPLVERALSDVAQGTATAQPQDPTRATYFHKRGEQESRIDFTQPAEDIALLVRAQSDPYPNAYFEFRGQRVRVLSAHVSQGRFGGTPGRVTIPHEGGIAVVCGSPRANVPAPAIVLDRVRLDDNSGLTATEFFGHRAGYIQPKV